VRALFEYLPAPTKTPGHAGRLALRHRRRQASIQGELIMTKRLGVASDHAGLELKRALVTELEKRGVVVREFGTT
jgi:hypothetical protein